MLPRLLLLAIVVCCSKQVQAQEMFELVVPGTAIRSTAQMDQDGLRITDGQGQSFVYARAPEFDSVDGELVGFANARLAKVIRWPAGGTGRMQIGDLSNGRAGFRESKMHVRRLASTTTQRPVVNVPNTSPRPASNVPSSNAAGSGSARMAHVAAWQQPGGATWAAHIGDRRQISFVHDEAGRWRTEETAGVDSLIPGAPLAVLGNSQSKLPTVYSTDQNGRLLRIEDGQRIAAIESNDAVPESRIAFGARGGRPLLWFIDRQGRLPELQADRMVAPDYVESIATELVPGGGIGVSSADELFTVDSSGAMRRYVRQAQWTRADPLDQRGRNIASGFSAGAPLSVTQATPPGGRSPTPHVFTFDANGIPRVLYETSVRGRWAVSRIGTTRHRPGAPITSALNGGRLRVAWVSAAGTWQESTTVSAGGTWAVKKISQGFYPAAPVLFHHRGRGFAIDRRGALVVAGLKPSGVWGCAVCLPGFTFAPTVVSHQVVANPPLPPANVEVLNTHRRELWVAITDLRAPAGEIRLKIKPGQSAQVALERDAGAQIIERFEVYDPFGGARIEQRVFDIPAEAIYDVSVYELWLQSVAIDSTKRGGGRIEDANWSPRSIGAFPLSAGPQLRDGDVIDVFRTARSAGNPGGVRHINPSEWAAEN